MHQLLLKKTGWSLLVGLDPDTTLIN